MKSPDEPRRSRATRGVRLAALVLLSASVALAPEARALSIDSAGTCRTPPCACTEADAKKLKGLIGRLRAAREAAELFRKEFNAAEARRVGIRDRIWGYKGSLAKFSNALLGMAASSPEVGKLHGAVSAGIGITQDHRSGASWADGVTEVLGNDEAVDYVIEKSVRSARQYADEFGRATGDWGRASDIFARDTAGLQALPWISAVAKVAGFGLALRDYWQSTGTLVKDLEEYAEAAAEAEALQAELDSIDRQIEQVLAEIAALRERCPEEAGAGGGTAAKMTDGAGSGRVAAALGGAGDRVAPVSDARAERALTARARSAARRLVSLERRLEEAGRRIATQIFPPLSPFMVNGWQQTHPRLLWELARRSLPHLRALPRSLEWALATGREVEASLRR